MAVIHTPETSGIQAMYSDGRSVDYHRRDVLGWDRQGRPLVMCGDSLHTATNAPFAKYQEYVGLASPEAPDWSYLMDTLVDRVWYNELRHIDFRYDIETAIREGVKEHLDERRRTLPPSPSVAFDRYATGLFDTFVPEALEAADESDYVDESTLWDAWVAYVFSQRQEQSVLAHTNSDRFSRRVASHIPEAQFRLGTNKVYGVKLTPLGKKWSHALDSLTTPFGRFLRDAIVRAADGNAVKPDDLHAAWNNYISTQNLVYPDQTVEQVIETVTTALPYVAHSDGVFHGIDWRSTQA